MPLLAKMHLVVPVTNEAGIGNTLKGLITALSLTDDATIQCNYSAMMGNFTNVLDERHICKDITKYDTFSTCRFLVLKTEEDVQQDLPTEISCYTIPDMSNPKFHSLFSIKSMIDWYYNKSLIANVVYERILRGIDKIVWSNVVLSEVARTQANVYSNLKNGRVMGVSVRTWTAVHERNINREYSTEKYVTAINDAVKMAQNDGTCIDCVFISYDNHVVAPQYASVLSSFPVISYVKPAHVTELQCAVIKMLVLSKTDYFVCNRISTFSELVYWFNRCRQKVFTVC